MKRLVIRVNNKLKYILSKYKKKMYYIQNYRISNPKLDIDNIDKVIFVAHPDDEILFFSQQLLNDTGWLVVCMTNGDHPIRLHEFINCMKCIKCSYQIWDFEDGLYSEWNEKKVYKKIKNILSLKRQWSKVLTHNEIGEYGHLQHKNVNKYIRNVYKEDNLYIPLQKSDLIKEENLLNKSSLNFKIDIIKKYYKSQSFIVDELSEYCRYECINE